MFELVFNLVESVIRRNADAHVISEGLDAFDTERYHSMLRLISKFERDFTGLRVTFSPDSSCVSASTGNGSFTCLPAFNGRLQNTLDVIQWIQQQYPVTYEENYHG